MRNAAASFGKMRIDFLPATNPFIKPLLHVARAQSPAVFLRQRQDRKHVFECSFQTHARLWRCFCESGHEFRISTLGLFAISCGKDQPSCSSYVFAFLLGRVIEQISSSRGTGSAARSRRRIAWRSPLVSPSGCRRRQRRCRASRVLRGRERIRSTSDLH